MTGRLIVVSIVGSLLFAVGCSKNRGWLSRNDYSEMQQDPFMAPEDAASKSNSVASKDAGRASLDDTESSAAVGRSRVPGSSGISEDLPGPIPIRQAGASNVMTEDERRTSQAMYPDNAVSRMSGRDAAATPQKEGVTSYSGPALSDFLQKKTAAARDSAGSTANEAKQTLARTASSPNAAFRESLNPAATHAALPTISPEAESFSNFLSENSRNTANDVRKASVNAEEAGADVSNFAAWAEQQKSEWSNSAHVAAEAAPSHAREKVSSVFEEARQAKQEIVDAAQVEPEFDFAMPDTAKPLIRQVGSADAAPALTKAKPPSAYGSAGDTNPFADSFGEFRSSDTTADEGKTKGSAVSSASERSGSAGSSLDDSFRMDTGWKPAQMMRP